MSKSERTPTFLDFVQDESGGRFSRQQPFEVVGKSPSPVMPQLPATSPWSGDPVPDEEPLGFSVEDMVPTGTEAEIAASIALREDSFSPSRDPEGDNDPAGPHPLSVDRSPSGVLLKRKI